MALIASVNAVRSGVSYFMVFDPYFFLISTSTAKRGNPWVLGCWSAQTSDAPAGRWLFPVFIRKVGVVESASSTVVRGAIALLKSLNGVDRGRQCCQFWSFVFHGFHLLSFVKFTYQLAN